MMSIMKALLCVAVAVTLVTDAGSISVKLKKRSTVYLPYSYQSGSPYYELKKIAAEQLAYDPIDKILYTVGDLVLHAIDVSEPDNMRILSYLEYPGMEFTDVEFCGGHVFAALDNHTDRAEGKAMVFTGHDRSTNQMKEILRVPVGAIPDMVKPTSDCTKLVVAVEGEGYEYPANNIIDPPGYVVIINFPSGVNQPYIKSTLGFDMFNDRVEFLRPSGVRHVYQENRNPFSNDVEPEYIAINSQNSIAYIVLQENNAVAKVDLLTQTISEIYGLGFKDWTQYKLDPSDRDEGYALNSYAVMGMYQPDSMDHFWFNGVEYLLMANEGDAKEYDYGDYQWTEDVRGSTIDPLDWWHMDYITRTQLADNSILGRLKISSSPSGRWPDGSFRKVYTYGARSWSIRRADDLSLVYDSGDDIATRTYSQYPDLFNCELDDVNEEPYIAFDTRSDNKGAEPEDVAVGEIDGTTLIFIATERPGTILVYSLENGVTEPRFQDIYTGIPQTRGKTWQQMYQERVLSEIDCEDMKFIPARDSPTGKPILLAAGSVSGTVSIIDIDVTG